MQAKKSGEREIKAVIIILQYCHVCSTVSVFAEHNCDLTAFTLSDKHRQTLIPIFQGIQHKWLKSCKGDHEKA